MKLWNGGRELQMELWIKDTRKCDVDNSFVMHILKKIRQEAPHVLNT